MFITMIIMGGAYSVFNSQQKHTTIQIAVSDMQQTLRAAMDFVARDIRLAGFDPEISKNFSITDIQFRDIDDNLDSNIATTGHSYIEFAWDKNEDGVLDDDERMNYSLVDGVTITPGVADLFLRFPKDPGAARDVIASNIVRFGLAYAIDADSDGELDQVGGETMWAVDADNDNDWDSLTLDQVAGTVTTTGTGISVNTRDIRAVRIWMLVQAEAPNQAYTDTNIYLVGPHRVQPNNSFRHRLSERTVLCRNMGLNL
jgi:type II secretory pathway component PulJ